MFHPLGREARPLGYKRYAKTFYYEDANGV